MTMFTYRVDEGLDPIRFGMTRADVLLLLGNPAETVKFTPDDTSSGLLNSILDRAGLDGLTQHLAKEFEGQEVDIYKDDNIREGFDVFTSITYLHGEVSKIGIEDYEEPVFFGEINLTEADLESKVKALFELSSETYLDSHYFYFKDLGIKLLHEPDDYIEVQLLSGPGEGLEEFERVTAQDIIEFFAPEEDYEDEDDEWE